jgi:hypothetical protein
MEASVGSEVLEASVGSYCQPMLQVTISSSYSTRPRTENALGDRE